MFLYRLILIILSLSLQSTNAIDAGDEKESSELSQQKDEILDTLSTLVGKKEKVVDKAGDVKVKVDDLKDAIKLLENKTERTKVIKALSALALLHQEHEKNQGIVEKVSEKITGAIEFGSDAFINTIKLTKLIPEVVTEQLTYLREDEAYRHNTYILIMILATAMIFAGFAEYFARRLLKRLNINRPQEYEFKRLHTHVIRNTTPVILFGIIGYLAIYLSQPEWNIITYRGFMYMNFVIMARSMGLLLRVIFGSMPHDNQDNTQTMSFQFALAGIQTIIIGIIFGEVGSLLGMGELALDIWLKIIGFGVTSLVVIGTVKNKAHLVNLFVADTEHLTGFAFVIAKVIEFAFKKIHIIFCLLTISAFIIWMLNLDLVALYIAKSLVLSAIVSFLFTYGRQYIFKEIIKTKIKLQLKTDERSKLSLNYLEGSTTNIIQSIWHLLFLLILAEIWGADPIEIATSPSVQPILTKAISIMIILVVIRTLWGWSDHIAQSHIKGRTIGKKHVESSQFVKTVTPILNSVAHWVLAIMAIILILVEFGQDVRPMLYSLGVIGIAISLGAQSLVKDIINGILTLVEGNIAVGEVITVGANTGTIESLSLRSIVLRHSDGAIQTIPFSEVTNIINRSRDYTSFSVNFLIPHRHDLEQAIEILNDAFKMISEDKVFGKMIIDPLHISGIDRFTDTGMNLTGSIKIKPDPKGRFAKAFNSYLQKQMDRVNFYPPASQKVLNVSE